MGLPQWGGAAAALSVALVASADSNTDRGKAAAQAVLGAWGSDERFSANVMEPMSSDKAMRTIDQSSSFGAKTGCAGSQRFMRLTLVPDSHNDLAQLGVELDGNLDGTTDQTALLAGPFAAICANGLVQCPAGTIDHCRYDTWAASGNSVALSQTRADGSPNTQADLGACYCVNDACGAGLLTTNSTKILQDIGSGIALAMQATTPRLAVARTQILDPLTAEIYGQQSGCGSDQQPEQYFGNANALPAAGSAAAADPDSDYSKVATSPVMSGHQTSEQACSLARSFTTSQVWKSDALTFSFTGSGTVTSCGDGCYTLTVGQPGDNYLSASCGLQTNFATITVNSPELVTSAVLSQVSYDDWVRARFNGAIVWNADPAWTGEGARCGENTNRGTANPGTDVTSWFTGTPAGTTLQVREDTAWSDRGEGWIVVQIQTRPDCQITSETVNDQCSAQESNPDCTLREESVDGTATVVDYGATGAVVPQSTQTVSTAECALTVTRDFFQKQRTYICKTSALPYSGADGARRYQSIHSSFNAGNGQYTDATQNNGAWTTSAQTVGPLPPADAVESCVHMCQTRRPRPGIAVADNGAVSQNNATGVAWDYMYRECGEDGSCPLEDGETMTAACDCRNNFGQAASMMQAIRMTAQDAVCQ